jgi:WD40 repeat protein
MTGKEIRCAHEHQSTIYACAVSGDGKYLATASVSPLSNPLHPPRKQSASLTLPRLPLFNALLSLDPQPSHHPLQADKSIKVFDMKTGQCLKRLNGHTSHVSSVCWIPDDSSRLISGSWDETIKIWDWQLEEAVTLVGHNSKVNCVCVSPDGDCIVSGGEDKLVKVWRISGL